MKGRKFLSLVLALVMTITLVPMGMQTVHATPDEIEYYMYADFEDNTSNMTGTYTGTKYFNGYNCAGKGVAQNIGGNTGYAYYISHSGTVTGPDIRPAYSDPYPIYIFDDVVTFETDFYFAPEVAGKSAYLYPRFTNSSDTSKTYDWEIVLSDCDDGQWHNIAMEINPNTDTVEVFLDNVYQKSYAAADINANLTDIGGLSGYLRLGMGYGGLGTLAIDNWKIYNAEFQGEKIYPTPEPTAEPTPVPTPAPATKTISPTDSNIKYIGRWLEDDNGAMCNSFQGSAIFKFTGTSFDLAEGSEGYVSVSIDGGAYKTLAIGEEQIASGLGEGTHTVEIYTMELDRTPVITGVVIDEAGELLAPEDKPVIEFIGDSILAGFIAPKAGSGFYDIMATYGSLTAKELGYYRNTVAMGGLCLSPGIGTDTEGMLNRYFMTKHYTEEEPTSDAWDTSKFIPDCIVINLGTNDSVRVSDADFIGYYTEFLTKLRNSYPDATIVMMTPFVGRMRNPVIATYNSYDDDNVYLLQSHLWGVSTGSDNLHPAVEDHQDAAQLLVPELTKILAGEVTKAPVPTPSPTAYIDAQFEGNFTTEGSVLNDVIQLYNSTGTFATGLGDNNTKFLTVRGVNTGGRIQAVWTRQAIDEAEAAAFEIQVYAPNETSDLNVELVGTKAEGSSGAFMNFIFKAADYPANEWVDFKVIVDRVNKLGYMYIDGEPYGDTVSLTSELDKISTDVRVYTTAGYSYDSLRLYECEAPVVTPTPEPTEKPDEIEYYMYADFENGENTIGGTYDGTKSFSGVNCTSKGVKQNIGDNKGYAFYIEHVDTVAGPYVSLAWAPSYPIYTFDGVATFETEFYFVPAEGNVSKAIGFELRLYDSSDTRYSKSIDIPDCGDGLWHHIVVKINSKTDTIDVFLDDIYQTSYAAADINANMIDISGLSSDLRVNMGYGGRGTLAIDNWKIYQAPETTTPAVEFGLLAKGNKYVVDGVEYVSVAMTTDVISNIGDYSTLRATDGETVREISLLDVMDGIIVTGGNVELGILFQDIPFANADNFKAKLVGEE